MSKKSRICTIEISTSQASFLQSKHNALPVFGRLLLGSCLWLGSLTPSTTAQTHDQAPLELSGFSVSESFGIADGQPLDLTNEYLHRLLYRVLKTSNENLQTYARFSKEISFADATASVSDYRLWVFDRRGRIRSIQRMRIPGVDSDAEIRSIYVADCVTESDKPFRVLTLSIPAAWKTTSSLNEPISFTGFLYALSATETNSNPEATDPASSTPNPPIVPTFLAKRLAWYPQVANDELGVTNSHVWLAKNGVDIGGFDFARQEFNQTLSPVDAEIFFQILTAVGSDPHNPELDRLEFEDLMKRPIDYLGNRVGFQARVKKCTRVQISDPETVSRCGFDHYYQLIVFPDLESQIAVKNPGQDDLVYRRFPATICSRWLPEGIPSTEIENQQIFVDGYYFRFWKYQSDLTDQAGASGQVSPLIMIGRPQMVESDEDQLNSILGGGLLVLLVALTAAWWFLRTAAKPPISATESLPEKIDLSEIDLSEIDSSGIDSSGIDSSGIDSSGFE